MAVLELKLRRLIKNTSSITANVRLYARGDMNETSGSDGVVIKSYPRILLREGEFTAESAADLQQIIKQKVLQFYNNLTPQQKAMVTGIAQEQL